MNAVALEDRMLAHPHLHIEITRGPTVTAGLALSREPHAITAVDPRRDLHR